VADISPDALRRDFGEWLALSAQQLATAVAQERVAEVARWECCKEEEQAGAVAALAQQIAAENHDAIRRLVEVCEEQRREAVVKIQSDARKCLDKERAQLDIAHARRVSDELQQLRCRYSILLALLVQKVHILTQKPHAG
jgi:uncharacterized protein YbjQ (UPF0145 family)